MNTLGILIKRNVKLFFKDKGVFFTSLITPLILLVLYATFLRNVYETSFTSGLEGYVIEKSIINGIVGGQLMSSLLAVSCITVAFCSNMIMVSDKVTGAYVDLTLAPVKKSTLALGYYIATAINTLLVCFFAIGASLIYLGIVGFYLSVGDILLIFLDVFILVMLGTALSSFINFFLSSQGQISAVGSIVSSCYGFICGAYMPISSFGVGLQKVLSFMPFTYGTGILRNHCMNGAFSALESSGVPSSAVNGIKDSVDVNLYFFDNLVSSHAMYLVLIGAVLLFLGGYIALNVFCKNKGRNGKVKKIKANKKA